MLLRRLYAMALEHPGVGFFGYFKKVGSNEAPSFEVLDSYTLGYFHCQNDTNSYSFTDDWIDFEEWMKLKDYFSIDSSTKSWCRQIIEEVGDGKPAFDRFKEILFEYLESELPQWFIDFNRIEQPSLWRKFDYQNDKFVPSRPDIRTPKHVFLVLDSKGNT